MEVGLLTIEQKNSIEGQYFAPDSKFYPIEDANGNWIISPQEMNGRVTNPDFFWVRDLPLIDYQPKENNI